VSVRAVTRLTRASTRWVRHALIVFSLCLSGCGPAPIYVQVEAWNRTLDPIFLLDQEGRRLDVPACGHAFAPTFRINEYGVWFEQGRYVGGAVGGQGGPPNERIFVLSSRQEPVVFVPPSGPLPELTPCEGHPTVENEH
jgi:hypothetical protein